MLKDLDYAKRSIKSSAESCSLDAVINIDSFVQKSTT